MKNLFTVAVLATGMFIAGQANAQVGEKAGKAVDKGANQVGKTAKKVGHKTSELASKGSSAVVDKVYKDRVGPQGQTIYIDDHSRYYWVDKKGHRMYVKKSELKVKM